MAIVLHFYLDTITHWQENLYPYHVTRATWIRLPIDIVLALMLVYWITLWYPDKTLLLWTTALVAIMPDIDSIVAIYPRLHTFTLFTLYWNWHCKIQRETSSLLGLIPQIIVCIASLGIAAYFS